MNHTTAEIEEFFSALNIETNDKVEAWIAPQSLYIPQLLEKKQLKVGAQNVSYETKGAFTGEISPIALKDLGATFTIVGHSERRQLFGETDQTVNRRTLASLAASLKTIVCVGETLEQREADKTFEIIKTQITEGLKNVTSNQNLVIAYEPVWAIGTGKTATPEQAQEVHQYINGLLEELSLSATPILYGGSVKPGNFKELLSMPNINGGLVGGASLKADDYSQLVAIASEN